MRITFTDQSTIGNLLLDGQPECLTLEDTVREVHGSNVSTWKVPGKTAIPRGVYTVILNQSNRFKRELPLLLEVPGFEGVRIHPGNKAEDTEGCILVGKSSSTDFIGESRAAFDALFAKMKAAQAAGEGISIEII